MLMKKRLGRWEVLANIPVYELSAACGAAHTRFSGKEEEEEEKEEEEKREEDGSFRERHGRKNKMRCI